MLNSKYLFAVSFEHDYSCNSLSLDMFASCEQVKGIVLMRQISKQRIFQMME